MSAKGGSWSAYRANWIISRGGMLFGTLILAALKIPHLVPDNLREAYHNWFNAHAVLGGALVFIPLVVTGIATLNVINWKCLRCGEFFAYPFPRGDCQNCGLKKFADPQSGE
ncbi:MAG: hypothetical protein R3C60_02925 [Parvularculaceae bacterium]